MSHIFFATSGTLFFQTSVLSQLYDIKFWAKAHQSKQTIKTFFLD